MHRLRRKWPNDVSEQFTVNVEQILTRSGWKLLCKRSYDENHWLELYAKIRSRQEKKIQVMADMRRLATLFFHLWSCCREAVRTDSQRTVAASNDTVCLTEMFVWTNFDLLKAACVNQTTGEGERGKSALMLSLYYLLIKEHCSSIINSTGH